MEALLKRYFWVINLGLLSGIAWGSARLTNQFISAELRAIPLAEASTTVTIASAAPAAAERKRWASIIATRNLFNANPPPPNTGAAAPEGEGEEATPSGQLPGPDDPCEAAGGALTLKATLLIPVAAPARPGEEPIDRSLLTIASGREGGGVIYRVGDEVEGYRIAALQRLGMTKRRVVLFKDNRFSCLGDDNGARPTPSPPPERPARRNNRNRGRNRSRQNRYSDMVNKVGDGQFEVNRSRLNEELEDMDALLRQARAVPHRQDGQTVGFKVVGVRSNSLFRSLGIRSGDVLTSVNGESLDSLNKALGLFEQLRSSDNLSLSVQRRGQDRTLEYSIR